jgi:hypothetical protein
LKRWSSTSGVCPIDSTMLAKRMVFGGIRCSVSESAP